MSPKFGVSHDYDLLANAEPSAHKQPVCVVCEQETTYRWSDYSGEAMCGHCGCTYQLKWGGEEREAEGNYPYLNLKQEWVPILRDYYQKTKQFTYLGMTISGAGRDGLKAFYAWVDEHHPEMATS